MTLNFTGKLRKPLMYQQLQNFSPSLYHDFRIESDFTWHRVINNFISADDAFGIDRVQMTAVFVI
jgi:hypothetical protein